MYELIGLVITPKKEKLTHRRETGRKHWYKRGREPGEGGGDRRKLQKEEWEECDAPRTKFEESNPSSYIDVRLSYSSQTYLCISPHKIRTRPLSNDQGQAFQAHSLQIILFGPITHKLNIILGSLKIVSLEK